MTGNKILINRAPVLTLWAAVVAERLGFNHDEALSLGKALAGRVDLLGRALPGVNTGQGVRAVVKSKPIEPDGVERYLESKFGDALPKVRKAMVELTNAFDTDELAERGFGLYEQFRPEVPEGIGGWGAKAELDLDRIAKLALQAH